MAEAKRAPLWGVRLSVFGSGAVGMALELVGSRLLAPTFGDSIFVWGSLIGVVMTGLAAGYYFGGRLADRDPSFKTFSLVILIAGVFTLVIPSSAAIVMETVTDLGLGDRFGPLVSCLLLLGVPTTLLGIVSPYAIRLTADNIVRIGGASGSLYSISTAGSIFGTFFTVFVLIPSFSIRTIILSLGVVLVAVSFIGLFWRERLLFGFVVALLMLPPVLLQGPMVGFGVKSLYTKDTLYSTLNVVDDKGSGTRALYLNNLRHSAMFLNGSQTAAIRYTDYFNLAYVFNPDIKSVLFIGGGGFSGPKQFLAYYPEVKIDVVEINPDVVQVAKDYFGVRDDPRLRIFVEDGRTFLERSGSYDLIVLDAYSKSYVPFHLMTLEFLESLSGRLNPGGVVVSNLIASFIGDTSDLMRAEYKTMSSVFSEVYVFYTFSERASELQNLILVATRAPRYSAEALVEAAGKAPQRSDVLTKYSRNLFLQSVSTGDVPLLTDDYAPAESLLNPVTLAPYEGGEELLTRSLLNPFIMAGAYVVAFAVVYVIIGSIRGNHGSEQALRLSGV